MVQVRHSLQTLFLGIRADYGMVSPQTRRCRACLIVYLMCLPACVSLCYPVVYCLEQPHYARTIARIEISQPAILAYVPIALCACFSQYSPCNISLPSAACIATTSCVAVLLHRMLYPCGLTRRIKARQVAIASSTKTAL